MGEHGSPAFTNSLNLAHLPGMSVGKRPPADTGHLRVTSQSSAHVRETVAPGPAAQSVQEARPSLHREPTFLCSHLCLHTTVSFAGLCGSRWPLNRTAGAGEGGGRAAGPLQGPVHNAPLSHQKRRHRWGH